MTAPAVRAAYWTRILAEWRHSGLTQAEFCRRRGLALHTFRDWCYRRLPGRLSSDRPASPGATPQFLPVRLIATANEAPQHAHRSIEILLEGGRRVAVTPGFDADTLRRVVDALESPSC
jgi:hypothetical protein